MLRRAVLVAVSVSVALVIVVAPASPSPAATTTTGRALLGTLSVKAESIRDYDRDKFKHWFDRNGDCQDTRSEVLQDESSEHSPSS
jgi:hypothetical protein